MIPQDGHAKIKRETVRAKRLIPTVTRTIHDVRRSVIEAGWGNDPSAMDVEQELGRVRMYERQQAEFAERRQAQGLHGICEGCGEPIDPDRLRWLENVTRCAKCASELERKQRQRPCARAEKIMSAAAA